MRRFRPYRERPAVEVRSVVSVQVCSDTRARGKKPRASRVVSKGRPSVQLMVEIVGGFYVGKSVRIGARVEVVEHFRCEAVRVGFVRGSITDAPARVPPGRKNRSGKEDDNGDYKAAHQ
jgi:hypothetical protein